MVSWAAITQVLHCPGRVLEFRVCGNMVAKSTFSMPSRSGGESAAPAMPVGEFASVHNPGTLVRNRCEFVASLHAILQTKISSMVASIPQTAPDMT